MGLFMKEHDIYIGTMLDELNLRFAPSQGKDSHFGGILEMADLQKEFKLFKKGRSFKMSCAALNLGARNNEVKNLWQNLLGNLYRHGSNKKGLDGDAAIVRRSHQEPGLQNAVAGFLHLARHARRQGQHGSEDHRQEPAHPLPGAGLPDDLHPDAADLRGQKIEESRRKNRPRRNPPPRSEREGRLPP
jgi:hypothetical protein